ncbi:MFS transporter [Kallotenue papyrolyticum]|uniref:MFS transporter n=1 Tax=Kallotenue papyrolyticum TaxID=1325125 RepID=UPI00046F571C|nr:MFS transporter [Kallotenue papyrolyticum]
MARDRAARRGLLVLLADTLLMYAGFFMLVPLIAVHYVDDLGFSAATIGLVLAARQLTQQGLTVFGGALADRWGAKSLIVWGLVIRTFSFAGMAWAVTPAWLLSLSLLAALGGALFDAPKSAAIAALSAPQERMRFFGLSGIAGAIGMTLGPLTGALLLPFDFAWVCFTAAACFAVAAALTIVWLPALPADPAQPMAGSLRRVLADRRFVIFTALLMGFWFLWVQLSISLPLAAQRWGTPRLVTPLGTLAINGVAWVYALNALLTLALQYPLLRLLERRFSAFTILMLGTALTAIGLGLVALAGSLAALLGCVALFSLGAMLVQPTLQTVTAALADAHALGAYFGFGALSLALGGAAGNYLGGLLFDLARAAGWPALPWLVFALVGLIVTLGLLALQRNQTRAAAVAALSRS